MENKHIVAGILIGSMWLAVVGVAFATRDGGNAFLTGILAFFGTWIIADRGFK